MSWMHPVSQPPTPNMATIIIILLSLSRFPLGQQQPGGMAHRYVNSHDVLDAPNLLTLQVTSLPYNLQTKKSRIAPQNEICMQTSMPQVSQNISVFRCNVSLMLDAIDCTQHILFFWFDFVVMHFDLNLCKIVLQMYV